MGLPASLPESRQSLAAACGGRASRFEGRQLVDVHRVEPKRLTARGIGTFDFKGVASLMYLDDHRHVTNLRMPDEEDGLIREAVVADRNHPDLVVRLQGR